MEPRPLITSAADLPAACLRQNPDERRPAIGSQGRLSHQESGGSSLPAVAATAVPDLQKHNRGTYEHPGPRNIKTEGNKESGYDNLRQKQVGYHIAAMIAEGGMDAVREN